MNFRRSLISSVAGICLMSGAAHAENLTVWSLNYSSDAQVSALDASVVAFEKTHPDVNVEFVKRGTDEHKTALRVASGSDTGPDVYVLWAGLGLGGEYVQAGLSTDLTPYFEKYGWGIESSCRQTQGSRNRSLYVRRHCQLARHAPDGRSSGNHLWC